MEKLRILLLEDQFLVAQNLTSLIEKLDHEVIGVFSTSADAIDAARSNHPDLALLDIHVQGKANGIEAGRVLSSELGIPIIYLTDLKSLEVFDLAKITRPHAFLNKPVSLLDLKRTIELAAQNQSREDEEFSFQVIEDGFFVKENHKREKVLFEDVLYLNADGSYCSLVTRSKTFVLSIPMKTVFERIQRLKGSKAFLRISRSYVVNSQHVTSMEGNQLWVGETALDIGKTYREDIQQRFPSI